MIDPENLEKKDGERGATAILMAVALVALIGFGALAVDIGMGLVVKSELQNVSDAATLAGTNRLARIYKTTPSKIMADLSGDLPQVRNEAEDYASRNHGGGVSIVVPDSDVLLGTYNPATGAITAATSKVRVVQVTARRDDTSNGTVGTGLANVLGINEMSVSARSAAALTPISQLNGGQGDFPIGISKMWFKEFGGTHTCGDNSTIVLFPTSTDSCAGWHTFTESPASAAKLATVVDGLRTGAFKSPVTKAGETFYNFTGGTVESRCSNLKDLFDAKKVGGRMLANVPVYDFACGNVSGSNKIVGFVRAEIQGVSCGSTKKLDVKVECGIVDSTVGVGGGAVDLGFLAMSGSMIN